MEAKLADVEARAAAHNASIRTMLNEFKTVNTAKTDRRAILKARYAEIKAEAKAEADHRALVNKSFAEIKAANLQEIKATILREIAEGDATLADHLADLAEIAEAEAEATLTTAPPVAATLAPEPDAEPDTLDEDVVALKAAKARASESLSAILNRPDHEKDAQYERIWQDLMLVVTTQDRIIEGYNDYVIKVLGAVVGEKL